MLARIVLAVAPALPLVMLAVNIVGVSASEMGIHVCLAENIFDFPYVLIRIVPPDRNGNVVAFDATQVALAPDEKPDG